MDVCLPPRSPLPRYRNPPMPSLATMRLRGNILRRSRRRAEESKRGRRGGGEGSGTPRWFEGAVIHAVRSQMKTTLIHIAVERNLSAYICNEALVAPNKPVHASKQECRHTAVYVVGFPASLVLASNQPRCSDRGYRKHKSQGFQADVTNRSSTASRDGIPSHSEGCCLPLTQRVR